MNPAPKQPDQSTYSGRFAARLRELREKKKLTIEDVVSTVQKSGYDLTAKTLYNWESGTRQPPVDAYPALANALQLKTVREILPKE